MKAERMINFLIKHTKSDTNKISDGYHTFRELYEHRIVLFIALARTSGVAWRSKYHADGTMIKGWFIMGIGRAQGQQITYHLPLNDWNSTNFCETFERAPEFDGHTSEDVLDRIARLDIRLQYPMGRV